MQSVPSEALTDKGRQVERRALTLDDLRVGLFYADALNDPILTHHFHLHFEGLLKVYESRRRE